MHLGISSLATMESRDDGNDPDEFMKTHTRVVSGDQRLRSTQEEA
jgi:hypothetical protein